MYIYCHPPIDYWGNAIVADDDETARILTRMPEEPRWDMVFKTYMPYEGELMPVYMCKANNNGTVYIFSDFDLFREMWIYEVKEDK